MFRQEHAGYGAGVPVKFAFPMVFRFLLCYNAGNEAEGGMCCGH